MENNTQNLNGTQRERKVDPLYLRSKPPRPSSGLNKRTVTIAIIGAAILLFIALVDGLGSNHSNSNNTFKDTRQASPGEAVRNLPNSYNEIVKESKSVSSKSLASIHPPVRSALDKYLEEKRLARLKQAELAHKSDISFSGIQLPTKPNRERKANAIDLPQLNNTKSSLPSNPRDNYNRQDEKYSFLNNPRVTDHLLTSPLVPPLSEYQLMAGSVIPGVLLTGINSDLPGKLTGQVSQNIFDTVSGIHLLIPQGTKTIGEYDSRIVYGQERVLVVWTRLIFPNGKSIDLQAMPGVDLSGYSGLSEKVNNHYGRLISGVVFGSVIGAGAQVARGSNRTINPSFGQVALEGAAQDINQAGQRITERNLGIQPTIEVSPGHRFNIFVTKDILLEPYDT